METIKQQGANWNTLRRLARDFGEVAFNDGENVFEIVRCEPERNGVVLVFRDGSEARFTATIAKDAS
jgi:hypothetical protein